MNKAFNKNSWEDFVAQLKFYISEVPNIQIYSSKPITKDIFKSNPDIRINILFDNLHSKYIFKINELIRTALTDWYNPFDENLEEDDEDSGCNSRPSIEMLSYSNTPQIFLDFFTKDVSHVVYKDGVYNV